MDYVSHSIELKLNSSGYRGEDVDEILPDFITDRNTTVGLTWYPSYEGPESFTLIIVVSIFAAELAKGFISELSKDLYEWSKSRLIHLFKKKNYPVGHILIKLNDLELECLIEPKAEKGDDRFLELFQVLPKVLDHTAPHQVKDWELYFDENLNSWAVRPIPQEKEPIK